MTQEEMDEIRDWKHKDFGWAINNGFVVHSDTIRMYREISTGRILSSEALLIIKKTKAETNNTQPR